MDSQLRFLQLKIMKATREHIKWIVRHRVEMLRDMNWSDADLNATEPIVRRYLEDSWDDRVICFLAIENELTIGGCVVSLFPVLPSSQTPSGIHGYIHNLFVEKECRKRGVATKLLDYAIQFCKDNGVSKCWLHSTDIAFSIYLKAGFKKCDNYYGLSLLSKTREDYLTE
jgi:GNAT superfamily N-acetyltransferase